MSKVEEQKAQEPAKEKSKVYRPKPLPENSQKQLDNQTKRLAMVGRGAARGSSIGVNEETALNADDQKVKDTWRIPPQYPTPTTGADLLRINEQNEMLKPNKAAISNFESEFKSRF